MLRADVNQPHTGSKSTLDHSKKISFMYTSTNFIYIFKVLGLTVNVFRYKKNLILKVNNRINESQDKQPSQFSGEGGASTLTGLRVLSGR